MIEGSATRAGASRRILVTGGAGFLGSHLCERLLSAGHEVICLDNFETGSLDNVAHLQSNDRFSVIEHDIIEPIDLQVHEIYNLGCAASPPHYQRDPIHTLKTSVFGAANLLELAGRTGARILQASTSEVYGDAQVHLQSESYWGNVNPFGPRSCYDEGKRAAETLFHDYHERRGVDIRIARIFNTYGPRMNGDDGRVVSNFIVQALRGEDLTVYGDGRQTRSFCFVDDLIAGLVTLMNRDDAPRSPVNLGDPDEYSIWQLAEKVIALTRSSSRIALLPLPVDDPRRRCPDITLARTTLGWAPAVSLEAGLLRTIAHASRAEGLSSAQRGRAPDG